jgi:hypothetical protein
MKKRLMLLTKFYKNNKVFKLVSTILIVIISLFIILVIFRYPITNPKFEAQFHNLTKDNAYYALKAINIEKKNSTSQAKNKLNEIIKELEALRPPKTIFEIVFNRSANIENDRKEDYTDAYKKFYDSPYWKYWEESEVLVGQFKEKKKEHEIISELYSKERYLTATTEKMLNEMSKLNKEMEAINNRLTEYYSLADYEYELFTKRLDKLYEKYY